MPFLNYNWSGDDKHQILSACDDKNPHDGTTWSMIAEIRRDERGHYWAWIYFPEFRMIIEEGTDDVGEDIVYPYWDMEEARHDVEHNLRLRKII